MNPFALAVGSQNWFEEWRTAGNLLQKYHKRMNTLLAAHPEMTKLAAGCVTNNGDSI
jgi:hypothetical protein